MGNEELWGKIVLFSILVILIVKIAQILFIISALLLIVLVIIAIVISVSNSEFPQEILVIGGIIVGVFVVSFIVGIAIPSTSLGSLVLDTAGQVVYVDNTISEAKSTIYVSLLEAMAPFFSGHYVTQNYIENTTITEDIPYQVEENYTEYYYQTKDGLNMTDNTIFKNPIKVSSYIVTAEGEKYCSSTCRFETKIMNFGYNFSVNFDINYTVLMLDQFGDEMENITIVHKNITLGYQDPTDLQLPEAISSKSKPFRLNLDPNSLKISFYQNENTLLKNITKQHLVNYTKQETRIMPVNKSKEIYVVDSKLYYLLVWLA